MKVSCLKFFFSVVFALFMVSCSDHDEPDESHSEVRRTVLVYAAAYNSLSQNLSDDMSEMEVGLLKSGSDADSCRWLVYKWDRNDKLPGLWELKITDDHPNWVCLKSYNNEVMSSQAERLEEVIRDVAMMSPSRDYGLVLWSHASGWMPARNAGSKYWFGDDTSHGSDSPYRHMDITDMAEAIPERMFSFIWADCCHMGGVEVAYELRDRCKKFVAYPTEVLADGMPYHKVMPYLLKQEVLLEKAAEVFFNYWDSMMGQSRSATVAVINQDALPNLAMACRNVMNGRSKPEIGNTQRYHRSGTGLGPYYDLLDLCLTYVDGDSDNEDYKMVKEVMRSVVTYAATTERFLELRIDPAKYCGLSSNLCTPEDNNDFYSGLKWYKVLYQ